MAALAEKKISGMGAILHENGVAFRVWAPHADEVRVIGSFNNWDPASSLMEQEDHGYWYFNIENAKAGDEYKFNIVNGDSSFDRIDPYAREVTNSVGNGVVHNPQFDWGDDNFLIPNHNEIVIYEMHIGTYHQKDENHPGGFEDAVRCFDHLKKLGVNAIEVMPVCEFAGDWSWGYNPAHIFAIEQAYGGPLAFKEFVKAAHEVGFAVIMDVVYNHFGPSDLDLWQFDGWSENEKGGIYFYNDWKSKTPWGDTRPDYGRGEVRQFIYDNAMMWLEEYRVDGLRYDMTAYIRKVNGIDDSDIPEGWGLMQWINGDIAAKYENKIIIAEDLQGDEYLTRLTDQHGAGFTTQWDAHFVHPIRDVVQQVDDESRDLWKIQNALSHRYNQDAFNRVIYSESHDEVANGKARVPEEINPDDPQSVYSQQRSTLAAALVMTAPGIPMLMQGQEFLTPGWFDDGNPLDWNLAKEHNGILRLYSDLIHLRLNRSGTTKGLSGQNLNVHHVNNGDKLLAFHRWDSNGPGDDVIVLANFSDQSFDGYEIGVPCEGDWKLRLNTGWTGYSEDYEAFPVEHRTATETQRDGFQYLLKTNIAPYAVLIFSQD